MKIKLLDSEGKVKSIVNVSYWSILKAYLISAVSVIGLIFLLMFLLSWFIV